MKASVKSEGPAGRVGARRLHSGMFIADTGDQVRVRFFKSGDQSALSLIGQLRAMQKKQLAVGTPNTIIGGSFHGSKITKYEVKDVPFDTAIKTIESLNSGRTVTETATTYGKNLLLGDERKGTSK